jgi:hypothetical protein
VGTGLLHDSDWEPLDGAVCRVLDFTPLAGRIEGGKVKSSTSGSPYASIEIESDALAGPTKGFITHRLDFQHLWEAFNVRGVGEYEESSSSGTRATSMSRYPAAQCPDLWCGFAGGTRTS